jgi:uncharacterized protein involved in exopolysaccharide biosynthesis
MADSFDAFEYLSHLRSNWRFIAAVCGIALAIAAGASLLLPRKYTATARIVIEPPGGGDQRIAVAVSPIYLESLKTYEHFATGDSLFLRALQHFGLRSNAASRPVESWKRSVLKVEIPRNTKILEISATLPDPKMAQGMALYLAQETVTLSRTVNREGDQGLVQDAERQAAEARARLDGVTGELRRAGASEPVEGLRGEIYSAEALRDRLRSEQATAKGPRAEAIRQQLDGLDREIARNRRLLGERTAHADILRADRRDAEDTLAAADDYVRGVRSAAKFRGEQLSIIDPGITPERPSSPNVPLIVLAALFFGLASSLVFLGLQFGFERRKGQRARPSLRMAARDA